MSNQPLFTPYRMGDLDLPNRIVMAPLTRMRAQSHDHVPTNLQAEYYAQRASAGLIIAEAPRLARKDSAEINQLSVAITSSRTVICLGGGKTQFPGIAADVIRFGDQSTRLIGGTYCRGRRSQRGSPGERPSQRMFMATEWLRKA